MKDPSAIFIGYLSKRNGHFGGTLIYCFTRRDAIQGCIKKWTKHRIFRLSNMNGIGSHEFAAVIIPSDIFGLLEQALIAQRDDNVLLPKVVRRFNLREYAR